MPSLSGAQIDKLGQRLRDADVPSDEDLRLFSELLADHGDVLREVADQLGLSDLTPATRLKTYRTTVDKLRRERRLTLRGIDDLAGARIVEDMTLAQQDALVADLLTRWPDAKVADRRVVPSHGYRAVHVVPRVRGCRVEIQVRTAFQDAWAQIMEMLGDLWGRGVRYGLGPDDPDLTVEPGGAMTRREATQIFIDMASDISQLEEWLNAGMDGATQEQAVVLVDKMYALAESLRRLRFGRLEP